MPYTGNLIRTAQAPDARQLPSPSAAHGDLTTPDPWPQNSEVPAGTGAEYEGTAMPVDMVIGGGMALDTPAPWERGNPHTSDAVLYMQHTDQEWASRISRAHEGREDRGWVRTMYSTPPFQFSGDVEGDSVWEGHTTPFQATGQADLDKYVQGVNSRPENNPERTGYVNGFRPGLFRLNTPNIDRWRPGAHRHYDLQPLAQRDAYVPVNQPNADPSPDGPQFPLFQRTVQHYMTGAAMWTGPTGYDDSLLATPVAASGADPVIDGSVL
jgi:hypothetical protein